MGRVENGMEGNGESWGLQSDCEGTLHRFFETGTPTSRGIGERGQSGDFPIATATTRGSFQEMSTVQEIEEAIERLPREDLLRLTDWLSAR
ncbi:MAG: hypothetical protein KDM64_06780, partial [Verrucomicrobiae bacterium]|nr:hypothetical protein [Verrucomicrobiae bacterium]